MTDTWKKDFGAIQAALRDQDDESKYCDELDSLECLYQSYKALRAALEGVREWANEERAAGRIKHGQYKSLRALTAPPTDEPTSEGASDD